MRIQTKLVLLILAAILPAVLLTAFVGYRINADTIQKQNYDRLNGLRSAKALVLQRYISNLRASVRQVSDDPRIIEAIEELARAREKLGPPKDPIALEQMIADYCLVQNPKEWISPTPQGARIQEIGLRKLLKRFEARTEREPDAKAFLAVYDRHAPYIGRLLGELKGYDFTLISGGQSLVTHKWEPDSGAVWSQGAYRNTKLARAIAIAARGRSSISDFEIYAPSRQAPAAFIVSPVLKDGKTIGAISFQIDSEELHRLMSGDGQWAEEGLGLTGETIIVGADQTLRNDPRLFRESPTDFFERIARIGVPRQTVAAIKRANSSVLRLRVETSAVALARQGKSGVLRQRGYLGEDVYASYQGLAIPGLSWSIITRIDSSEVNQPLQDLLKSTIAFAIVLGLLGVLAAIWIARGFVKPLRRMIEVADEKARGNNSVRVALKREDEFGTLARAFNQMLDKDEKADEVANKIRANIVHDLKNPVTVIKGFAETLSMEGVGEDPELRSEMLGAIIEKSGELLDDLRDLLHPVDASAALNLEPFDLSTLVQRVVKAERHTGRSEHHEILVEGLDQPVMVTADRRKIRRVLENLLSNAVKYSPGEGKRVWISLESSPGHLDLVVRDEGLGMNPEQLKTVLSDGGRIQDAQRSGIEGTGLGLGSVRTILDAHGGALLAESEPGKGSRFTMRLPLKPDR